MSYSTEVKFRVKKNQAKNLAIYLTVTEPVTTISAKLREFLNDANFNPPSRIKIYVDEINNKDDTLTVVAEWFNRDQKWFIKNKLDFWIVWANETFIVMNKEEFENNWERVK